jgi:hypothetical protein
MAACRAHLRFLGTMASYATVLGSARVCGRNLSNTGPTTTKKKGKQARVFSPFFKRNFVMFGLSSTLSGALASTQFGVHSTDVYAPHASQSQGPGPANQSSGPSANPVCALVGWPQPARLREFKRCSLPNPDSNDGAALYQTLTHHRCAFFTVHPCGAGGRRCQLPHRQGQH